MSATGVLGFTFFHFCRKIYRALRPTRIPSARTGWSCRSLMRGQRQVFVDDDRPARDMLMHNQPQHDDQHQRLRHADHADERQAVRAWPRPWRQCRKGRCHNIGNGRGGGGFITGLLQFVVPKVRVIARIALAILGRSSLDSLQFLPSRQKFEGMTKVEWHYSVSFSCDRNYMVAWCGRCRESDVGAEIAVNTD